MFGGGYFKPSTEDPSASGSDALTALKGERSMKSVLQDYLQAEIIMSQSAFFGMNNRPNVS